MCSKEDILERQIFIDKVIAVVENLSKEKTSCSFAIEGQWGTGKSFVLDRFEKQISEIQSG
ncbi:MAG: P-loop NTPase fold protein [Aminipila sp.]